MSHQNITVTRAERNGFVGWQIDMLGITIAHKVESPTSISLDNFVELIVDGLSESDEKYPKIGIFQAALMMKQNRGWFNSAIGRELISLRDTLCSEIREVMTNNSDLEIFLVGKLYNIRVVTKH